MTGHPHAVPAFPPSHQVPRTPRTNALAPGGVPKSSNRRRHGSPTDTEDGLRAIRAGTATPAEINPRPTTRLRYSCSVVATAELLITPWSRPQNTNSDAVQSVSQQKRPPYSHRRPRPSRPIGPELLRTDSRRDSRQRPTRSRPGQSQTPGAVGTKASQLATIQPRRWRTTVAAAAGAGKLKREGEMSQ